MRIALCVLFGLIVPFVVAAPLLSVTSAAAYEIETGSWGGMTLQDVLDMEYGPGAVDADSYFGSGPADPPVPYWLDSSIGGLIFKEIAGFKYANTMGWYIENGSMPTIDGIDDGVIFEGADAVGDDVVVQLPGQVTFGLWLDPNGPLDSHNAPQGEFFFTNRFFNDIGPDGDGTTFHGPYDGDPQALIFNLTPLNSGNPTFVVAWEDLDYGSRITLDYDPLGTDNDFTDMVVEIRAFSPVPTKVSSFGKIKGLFRD
ncbi:hypothetical protein DRQ32_03175 [bacterium]|nr:MAG: hypothetical protein DRQ32_03175 [bacterium]